MREEMLETIAERCIELAEDIGRRTGGKSFSDVVIQEKARMLFENLLVAFPNCLDGARGLLLDKWTSLNDL